MPIDFAAVADQFRGPLVEQTRGLTPVFERLAAAVKKLSGQADAAERATRAYPVLRYRDGALAVRVHPAGEPLLQTQQPLGFSRGLQAGGREFLAGIGWTRTAVEQERALPRILGVGASALELTIASIDRFAVPRPEMFDPRTKRLSDTIGLLVLAYNSLLGPAAREQLLGVAGGAKRTLDVYEAYTRLSPAEAAAAAVPPVGAIDATVALLDEQAVLFLDLVLILPVLGDVLATAVHDGSLEAKRLILVELGDVEAQVVALRAAAIDGLLAGADLGDVAARWLAAARIVVLSNVDVLTLVAPSLLGSLLDGTRAFAEGLTAWGKWVATLLDTFTSINNTVMSFDLVGYALRSILPDWLVDRLPAIPVITIGDVIDFLMGIGGAWVKDKLDTFFDRALRVLNAIDHLPWVDIEDFYWKVEALGQIFNIVLTFRPFRYPPDVVPPVLGSFPDVFEALFGAGREAAFLTAIDGFGVEARTGIRGALGGASTLMGDLGTTFAREADRAAVLGSPARLRELAVDAADMSERVFGPEADRAREQAAARRPDAVASAFEDAVTSGGFELVGAAIPAYVGEMRSFWAKQRAARVERPTSPHILARHGRLGGVRVPRMTVNAPRRRPDQELATLVADRFHTEVGAAYLSGRREFERLGGAPSRRAPRGRGR